MKNTPFVSIIIVTYNNENTLSGCLDSLLSIGYPNYEIIIVNDASTDKTLDIIKKYAKKNKKIKIVSHKFNKGISGARNTGMKVAKGDILVFSDGDCKFYKNWPSKLIEALQKNPKAGAAGGRDKAPPNEPLVKRCIDYTMTSFIGTGGLRGSKMRLGKYVVTGCNFAIKREAIEKVGNFNEIFKLRGDEKELCQRIRNKGYDIKFVPDSFVLHYRRSSLKKFWSQTYESGKTRFYILKECPKAVEVIHITPSLFILFLILSGMLSLISVYSFYIFITAFSLYFSILLIQAFIGMIKLRNVLAFFIIPLTTIIMHFAYGSGFIVKFLFG